MGDSVDIDAILETLFGQDQVEKNFTRDEMRTLLSNVIRSSPKFEQCSDQVLLDNLLKHLPDKIYFKDLESQFLRVNQSFAQSHGFASPEAMAGKTDFDLFPYKLAIEKFADEQKVIQNNEILQSKDEIDEYQDGSIQWVSTTKMPLFSGDDELIGSFGISRDITDRKLAEIALQKLADQLKQKNEQIESDLEMARKVQMAFLPKSYPSFIWDLSSNESALDFHHRYFPSETLAGDFFQIIPISNSQAGVIVCDVMGHGVRASLVTAVLRGLVGEMKLITPYPHVFLRKINQSLNTVFKQLDMMLFVTAFYAVFDLLKGELRYANAGHPAPLMLRRSTGQTSYLDPVTEDPEPALGLLENFRFSYKTIPVFPGDSVLFYTDGITESENEEGQQFGAERLKQAFSMPDVASSASILESLFASIHSFSQHEAHPHDDMCAIAVDVVRTASDH